MKFDAVPPLLIVPDSVCFGAYAPDPESIFVVNPVVSSKLIPLPNDHVFPFTVRVVKSSDVTNEDSALIVVKLL